MKFRVVLLPELIAGVRDSFCLSSSGCSKDSIDIARSLVDGKLDRGDCGASLG